MTHFKLFVGGGLFVVQHVRGELSWHGPCVATMAARSSRLMRFLTFCRQDADGNKPATMFLLLLKQQTGHLCTRTWGITWSWDFGQIAHWSHVNIAHHQIVPPGSSSANRTHARPSCRVAGFFWVMVLSFDENTPMISLLYLPSYLLATLGPPLTSTLDVALHHKSDGNSLATGSGFHRSRH